MVIPEPTDASHTATPTGSTQRQQPESGSDYEYSPQRSKRPVLVLPCPFFIEEKSRGLPHSCNGLNAKTMSEVRRHLHRPHRGGNPHLPFLIRCRTCLEDLIDENEVTKHGYHGELCNNPRADARGIKPTLTHWHALYRKIFPLGTASITGLEDAVDTHRGKVHQAAAVSLPAMLQLDDQRIERRPKGRTTGAREAVASEADRVHEEPGPHHASNRLDQGQAKSSLDTGWERYIDRTFPEVRGLSQSVRKSRNGNG